MPKDPNYFAVIDLETTGTDEHADPIIEIGMVVVDVELAVLDSWSTPINPGTWPVMDKFVVKMHSDNGLLSDCTDFGLTRREAEIRAVDVLERWGRPHEFMLAGSGVSHFDRRFLKAQMPTLEGWFQYPNMDIGVVRRFGSLLGGVDVPDLTGGKPHRALDDARIHLQEMRNWRAFFQAAR